MGSKDPTDNRNCPSYHACVNDSPICFIAAPEDKYMCAFCGRILRAPLVQTLCGHRMSAACARELFREAQSRPCPAAEEGCEVLHKNKGLHPDRATERELSKLKVYCPYRHEGCNVTLTWSQLKDHVPKCDFNFIKCRNQGCERPIKASQLERHEAEECDYRLLVCGQCDQSVSKHELHNGHSTSCKPISKTCPLAVLGCRFEGIRSEIEKHLVRNHMHHIELGVKHWVDMQKKQQLFEEHLEQNESQLRVIKETVDKISKHNTDDMIHHISNTLEQLSKNIDEVRKRLDAKVDNQEFIEMKANVAALSNKLERNERNSTGLDPETSSRMDTMSQSLTRMESVQTSQEVRLSDADLRFRLLETASYDGKLMWKITQYTRRKQDAVDGRTVSLYSQPFYSSNHGYKMCGRVYLHGDGLGKGSHLSVFFVIMHGEYDALLSWPFRQKVTLTLLDQSGGRRHISDSFRPDPTSSSFRRPHRDMNVASGSPMFATHAQVEHDSFLREDTIFIMVTVDLSDMPQL